MSALNIDRIGSEGNAETASRTARSGVRYPGNLDTRGQAVGSSLQKSTFGQMPFDQVTLATQGWRPSAEQCCACRGVRSARPIIGEALVRLRDYGLVRSHRGSGPQVQHCPSRELIRVAPVRSIGAGELGVDADFAFHVAVVSAGSPDSVKCCRLKSHQGNENRSEDINTSAPNGVRLANVGSAAFFSVAERIRVGHFRVSLPEAVNDREVVVSQRNPETVEVFGHALRV